MNTVRQTLKYAYLVKRTTGKSFFHQAIDILRLRTKRNVIGLTEYFELELFDDTLYSWDVKKYFIGHRFSAKIDRLLNDNSWRAIAYDKVVNYSILKNRGFPIPEPIATYNKNGRCISGEASLTSIEEVYEFLKCQRPYPLFIKPIHGYSGVGAYGILSVDTKHGFVDLINGQRIKLEVLIRDFLFEPYDGMLFQRMLTPAAPIAEIFGERLSCIRVIVLLTSKGPKIHIAFWKIARNKNMVDNFSYGQYGNMLGWINIDNGHLERVIQSFWPNNREVEIHPDTGKTMKEFFIPEWSAIKELCLSASVNFPGLKIQSWDVALCDTGPVIIELNTDADLEIPQWVGRKAFLDEVLLGLMKSIADRA